MKRIIRMAIVLAALSPLAAFGDDPERSAQDILDAVVERLPREPMHIEGDLVVRRRRGVVVRELRFDMFLRWGASPAESRYTIRDAFGRELETLSVTRPDGAAPRMRYTSAAQDDGPREPPLFSPIQGSDVSWIDLSLSFLWWPGGTVTGREEVRGRECYVLEVPAPERAADAADAGTPYGSVRLWIDRELLMLLQAEGLDASRQPLRTLWVKSLKKIDNRWMIKDMEIQSYPAVHRTRLHVRDVSVEAPQEGARNNAHRPRSAKAA